MNEPVQRYGQMDSEKRVEENTTARQIVREVANFGITERQRLLIIYLLALELEDIESMRAITLVARECAGQEVFLTDAVEEGEDGTS